MVVKVVLDISLPMLQYGSVSELQTAQLHARTLLHSSAGTSVFAPKQEDTPPALTSVCTMSSRGEAASSTLITYASVCDTYNLDLDLVSRTAQRTDPR